jgi:large subunit ribosomal protein L24
MHIRKNDIVQIITGDDRGKSGKVLFVDVKKDTVLVEGINFVWKHLRRSQQHPHGARIQKEAPMHRSDVMVICQACNKPTRITMKALEKGGRVRICRKCRQGVAPETA